MKASNPLEHQAVVGPEQPDDAVGCGRGREEHRQRQEHRPRQGGEGSHGRSAPHDNSSEVRLSVTSVTHDLGGGKGSNPFRAES